MKTIIIMPAYNEEQRIGKTLERYLSYFEALQRQGKEEYELVIVINNTTDLTLDIVKRYMKRTKSLSYLMLSKGGKGYAVIEGFKHALTKKCDAVGFVDADCATPPREFHRLIEELARADGVIASRYLPGSRVNPKQSLQRIISSRIYNILIRTLFLLPYRDTQCGAKVFKQKALAAVLPSITMTKWAFDLDLIYNFRKKGYTVAEVPTTWSDQHYEVINFLSAGPFMALDVIRLRLYNSPFGSMLEPYDRCVARLRALFSRKKHAIN